MCLNSNNPDDQIIRLCCGKRSESWGCGISDQDVFKVAQERKSIIVTYDRGFGDTTKYQSHSHYGIIVIKAHDSNSIEQCHVVLKNLLKTETEFAWALFIVDRNKYRKR